METGPPDGAPPGRPSSRRSRRSPRTTGVIALLPLVLLLCSAPIQSAFACTDPPREAAAGGGRGVVFAAGAYVLIAPFNLPISLPRELHGKTGPVSESLLGYLQRRGVSADPLPGAYTQGLWHEVRESLAVGAYRPSLKDVCAGLARSLAERERFDYLLVPTLVPRLAAVRGERARWDGVNRQIVLRNYQGDRMLQGQAHSSLKFFASQLSGRLGAASIHLAVLDSKGELVYDGIGGLSLLQEAHGNSGPDSESLGVELVTREEPFERARDVREGIRIAFERRLPTSLPGRR